MILQIVGFKDSGKTTLLQQSNHNDSSSSKTFDSVKITSTVWPALNPLVPPGNIIMLQQSITFLKSQGYHIVTIKHHGHEKDDITLQSSNSDLHQLQNVSYDPH
jgi:molybdopterin-guanine dinucleotide biosynthesis protein